MIEDEDTFSHGKIKGAEEIMRVVWCPQCKMYELEINADTKQLGDVNTEDGLVKLLEALDEAKEEIEEFTMLVMGLMRGGNELH